MEKNNKLSYIEGTYKYGRIWGLVLFGLIFAFPFILCIIFSAKPEWSAMFKGILGVMPLYCTVGVIEMFTYIPMLGAGGSYMSFVTGNIANLKLPCALDALGRANVSASSEEGECISTIAIATSNIVTTLIIIVGVILIAPLSKLLSDPVLAPAFNNILPALFGGLAVAFVIKCPKLAAFPIILMLILFIAVPALNAGTVSIMVPVGVVFTIVVARILYKKGKI